MWTALPGVKWRHDTINARLWANAQDDENGNDYDDHEEDDNKNDEEEDLV